MKKMKRIANMDRSDFLMLLEEGNIQGSTRRYIQRGEVEVLGLFLKDDARWLAKVSKNNGDVYLIVTQDRLGFTKIVQTKSAPDWSLWRGHDHPKSPVNCGDNPTQYTCWKSMLLKKSLDALDHEQS